jgi:DNA-binding transcriptional ArsR family regulator
MPDALTDTDAISSMRAVAHPVRLRILSLLTAQALSAAEVARALELTHANASYHLRLLHDAGELVVESEEKIRGGMAKRYRYVVHAKPSAAPVATEDLIGYVHAIGTEVTRRVVDRRKAPSHWVDIETWVEPEVWEEALALANRASELLHASARPVGAEGAVHVSYSGMAFRMGPMDGAES